MGSLPPDTRCGWCGRTGAGYIPDGIFPRVPLCGGDGSYGDCLWGLSTRVDVMERALLGILRLSTDVLELPTHEHVIHGFWRLVAAYL